MKTFSIYGTIFLLCICFGLSLSKHHFEGHNSVATARFVRSPQEGTNNNECRYEKGPWQECDTSNGMQKRILTLRTAGSVVNAECAREKSIERPCKKQCKYTKGVWSECTNGSKERVDKLRTDVSTAGCKPEKQISKHCKKQCTYEKSEWTACENGIKTKTLTLVEGASNAANSADCEPIKTITKACSKGPKPKRFRKKNREQVEG